MPPRRAVQQRALWARTNASLGVNSPAGFPSAYPPIAVGFSPPADIPQPSWWMGSDSWEGILNQNGSILPAVTRCTDVIVGSLIRTPWTYLDADDRVLPRPLWVDDPMLIGRVPGPVGPVLPAGQRLDGHSFWSTFVTHALWYGRGAFVCVEAADGTPLAGTLTLLNPYMISVNDSGRWVINQSSDSPIEADFDGRFSLGSKTWRLVVLRGLTPNDGTTPEGVLLRHVATLRLGVAIHGFLEGTIHSGIPAGYLQASAPIKPDMAAQLKADWMQAHGQGRRSIALLNSSVAFTPISISPMDAQAEQLAKATDAQVAMCFNLDPVYLGQGPSGLQYLNGTDRRKDLVDLTLGGWDDRLTATLSALLPYGSRVQIDWAQFTRPSIEQHMPALVQGVQTGIISALEARAFLGLAPSLGPDPAWRDTSPAVNPAPEPQPVPILEADGEQE